VHRRTIGDAPDHQATCATSEIRCDASDQAADGSIKEYPEKGVRPSEVAAGIGKRLAEAAVAAALPARWLFRSAAGKRHGGADRGRIWTSKIAGARCPATAHHGQAARDLSGVKLAFGPTTATGFYMTSKSPTQPL
jgi:threonyl-tRNA synthetase